MHTSETECTQVNSNDPICNQSPVTSRWFCIFFSLDTKIETRNRHKKGINYTTLCERSERVASPQPLSKGEGLFEDTRTSAFHPEGERSALEGTPAH